MDGKENASFLVVGSDEGSTTTQNPRSRPTRSSTMPHEHFTITLESAPAKRVPLFWVSWLIALLPVLLATGCGGRASSPIPPSSVTVSVIPSSPNVLLGNSQQFSAT